jgi:hypothetical protein
MNLIMARLIKVMLSAASFALFIVAAGLALLLYVPVPPPYEPRVPIIDSAHMAGDVLVVTRWFNIRRSVSASVFREIIKVDDGILSRWEVPNSVVDLSKDDVTQTRLIPLNHLPSGTYHFQSTMCWRVNFIRRECIKLPRIEFSVD